MRAVDMAMEETGMVTVVAASLTRAGEAEEGMRGGDGAKYLLDLLKV
jgi:hypothetical protein